MMATAAGAGVTYAAARGHARQEGWLTVQRTTRALGTDVSITAMHRDAAAAERAITAAFAELEHVESLMSLYRPQSQLSRLNRDGILLDAHPHLLNVLRHAAEVSRQTRGAFDVTVQPLWAVYADAQKAGTLPVATDVAAARQKVDYRRVRIEGDGERVRLLGDGAAITLNGIAQGFAADRVARTLREHGIEHALIDTGEVGALGSRSDGEAWTIGIQHPRRTDAYLSLAKLAGRHLATSGDYATTFSSDYRHHHLFDPHTGGSAGHFASVSIAAPSGMQADALSTAIFVLGPERGREMIDTMPGVDAMLVLRDGDIYTTPGFPLA
jgi:thiamine biosynthesis lipoprotein